MHFATLFYAILAAGALATDISPNVTAEANNFELKKLEVRRFSDKKCSDGMSPTGFVELAENKCHYLGTGGSPKSYQFALPWPDHSMDNCSIHAFKDRHCVKFKGVLGVMTREGDQICYKHRRHGPKSIKLVGCDGSMGNQPVTIEG